MNLKKWVIGTVEREKSAEIAEEYQIPHVLAMLLEQRSEGSKEKIENLLYDDGFSESPFELIDMDKATDRIRHAVDNFERIAIYGDYDADGVTATSILYDYLVSLEADVMYYIPMREGEGYGMNKKAVEYLNSCEVKLIITVDNGISAIEEVDLANSLGMDVVITDHHRPSAILPNAYAVVDPHRVDCPSYFKDYCGAGIALKLVLAMELDFGDEDEIIERYADLATIGTIADIVSLTGENRTIVRKGLEIISQSNRIGINAILEKAGVSDINSTSVAFSIVPRINATGRMGSAGRAVKLLTSNNEEDALLYAEDICAENENRKKVEQDILTEAVAKIENNHKIKYARVIVIEGESWHPGVIGIVASRILERYGKPCIVISVEGNKGVGSGRSFGEFSLFDAIGSCSEYLTRFGGHHMAAGLSVDANNIDLFRNAINDYAKLNFEQMPIAEIYIDLKLQPKSLSVDIPEQIAYLEPFGKDNPSPIFGLFNMELQNITAVGSEKNHLRLTFIRDDKPINCMLFGHTLDMFPYTIGTKLDLAVTLDVNTYRGMKSVSIIIKAVKPSEMNIENQVYAYSIYEKFIREEKISQEEIDFVSPNRDDIAEVYRMIKLGGKQTYSLMQIVSDLKVEMKNIAKVILSLKALEECNLIKLVGEEFMKIEIIPPTGKVDIMNSEILRKIRQ